MVFREIIGSSAVTFAATSYYSYKQYIDRLHLLELQLVEQLKINEDLTKDATVSLSNSKELKSRLLDTTKNLKNAVLEVNELKDKLSASEFLSTESSSSLKNKLSLLQFQFDELQKNSELKILALQADISTNNTLREVYLSQLTECQLKFNKIADSLNEKITQFENLTNECNDLKLETNEKSIQIQNLSNEKQSLKDQLDSTTKDYESMKTQLTELQTKLDLGKANEDNLQKQIHQLNDSLNKKDTEIQSKNEKIQDLQLSANNFNEKLESCKSENSKSQNQLESQIFHLEMEKDKEIKELTDKIKSYDFQISESQNQFESQLCKLELDKDKEIFEILKIVKKSELDILTKDKSIEDLTSDLQSKQLSINDLNSQIEQFKLKEQEFDSIKQQPELSLKEAKFGVDNGSCDKDNIEMQYDDLEDVDLTGTKYGSTSSLINDSASLVEGDNESLEFEEIKAESEDPIKNGNSYNIDQLKNFKKEVGKENKPQENTELFKEESTSGIIENDKRLDKEEKKKNDSVETKMMDNHVKSGILNEPTIADCNEENQQLKLDKQEKANKKGKEAEEKEEDEKEQEEEREDGKEDSEEEEEEDEDEEISGNGSINNSDDVAEEKSASSVDEFNNTELISTKNENNASKNNKLTKKNKKKNKKK